MDKEDGSLGQMVPPGEQIQGNVKAAPPFFAQGPISIVALQGICADLQLLFDAYGVKWYNDNLNL